MKKTIITIASLIITLISCGPSKEQIAAEGTRKNDSAIESKQQQLIEKQAKEQAAFEAGQQQLIEQQAKEQADAEASNNQYALKQQLIDLKSQLAAEESKMDDIQGIKLFRTQDEKSQQIADQTRVIEELKNQIIETEKQIIN